MSETSYQATQRFRESSRRCTERKPGQRVLGVSSSEQEVVAAADHDRDAAFGHIDPAVQHRRSTVYLYAVLKYVADVLKIEPRGFETIRSNLTVPRCLIGRYFDLPWLATAAAALATSSGSPR